MKTTTAASLLLAATVALASPFAAAKEPSPSDRAAQLLAAKGTVPVQAAGPHVERGTFRIQLSTKLGRPDLVLSDGTWLYHNRTVEGSNARGTLVVRFDKGRVSDLALVTPAVVAALRADPRQPLPAEIVATK
jgi:hypothetical protein